MEHQLTESKPDNSSFEVQELREMNESLVQRITEMESEQSIQLETMGTIIAKNEELQRELSILTRALELQDESQSMQSRIE